MKTFDCQCADTTGAPPDPRKHVNYVHGMLLGVDDLIQEFAYHQEQRQWLARDAIGYGTLNGLRVEVFTHPQNGIQLAVNPGTALSPRGQFIRVAPKQCASLNAWLALSGNQEEVAKRGSNFDIFVVLCFRDCKVDPLPVPGEPCRCEDQAKAPSRILDDFRLELRFDLPAHREEKAIRDFVAWLRQIKVSDAPSASPPGGGVAAFLDALRVAFAETETSPLTSPPVDIPVGSPPNDLVIPAGELCEYLRAALRFWVVELRPRRQAQWTLRTGGGCECHAEEKTSEHQGEECLLLARVNLTLTSGEVAAETDVVVDDSTRPFVTHLRMLQEMLLCGPCCGGGCHDRTFATVFALDEQTLRIWIHHTQPVSLDSSAVQLAIDDSAVSGFTIAQLSPADSELNVFDLTLPGGSPGTTLQRGDRAEVQFNTQLITEIGSPSRTLAEVQTATGWCYPDAQDRVVSVRAVVNLANSLGALDGDVTGPAGDNTLTRIQARTVNLAGLADKSALGFDSASDEWRPLPIPQPSVPADLKAEKLFGTDPDPGSSSRFALADHTHGTPPNPIPPHVNDLISHSAHEIHGDVDGTLGATNVRRLRGVPISAQPVTPGDNGKALIFNNGNWTLGQAQASGNFVEHPTTSGYYAIVAAGWIEFAFKFSNPTNATAAVADSSSYNQFSVVTANISASTGHLKFTFNGYPNQLPGTKNRYVVKALPWFQDVRSTFNVGVLKLEPDGILFGIFRLNDVTTLRGRIMVEVGEFRLS